MQLDTWMIRTLYQQLIKVCIIQCVYFYHVTRSLQTLYAPYLTRYWSSETYSTVWGRQRWVKWISVRGSKWAERSVLFWGLFSANISCLNVLFCLIIVLTLPENTLAILIYYLYRLLCYKLCLLCSQVRFEWTSCIFQKNIYIPLKRLINSGLRKWQCMSNMVLKIQFFWDVITSCRVVNSYRCFERYSTTAP
jgi:hypothetical protein